MEIPKNLKDEIWEYCRLNDISNIDDFIVRMVKQGYTVEKFGSTPMGSVEVKEVEKVVEVVLEKIVEKVVEVPVEKIVEKEIFITDDNQVNVLGEKINELNNQLSLKDSELENIKKEFSTKTTEIDTIRKEFSTKTEEMENIFQNKIDGKDKEIETLKKNIEELSKNNKNDIYGDERRGGWFGSNILKR
jgi:predicted HicB family RNase H-like nuclease